MNELQAASLIVFACDRRGGNRLTQEPNSLHAFQPSAPPYQLRLQTRVLGLNCGAAAHSNSVKILLAWQIFQTQSGRTAPDLSEKLPR